MSTPAADGGEGFPSPPLAFLLSGILPLLPIHAESRRSDPATISFQKEATAMYSKKNAAYYHMLMIPGLILLLIFNITPMFGFVIAFQKYLPAKGILGSKFVGFSNFQKLFLFADFRQSVVNTVIIALLKIVFNIIVPVFFALALNECRSRKIKRTVQTIVYLPYFISWVILSVVFTNLFSLTGLFNVIYSLFGGTPQLWMIKPSSFRTILVATDVWKNFGYGAIVYLAAITNIDPGIYEACEIDGANRLQRIWYMTLPSIVPTIILMLALSLGNVLNAGFDQVYTMYSPLVYSTGDIIDTYVYRVGLENMQFSLSTAIGMIKSVIGFVMIGASQLIAKRFAGYSIF